MSKIKTKRPVTTTFNLPREDMIELDRISSCISQDKERPHICGALMEAVDGKVRFVATDGHRLGYAEVPVLDGLPPLKAVTIPGGVVSTLVDRLAAQSEAAVTVALDGGAFRIECGRFCIGDDLVAEPFPDYRGRVLAVLDGGEFADVTFDSNALFDIVTDAVGDKTTIDIQNDHISVAEFTNVYDDVPCTVPQGWTPRTIRLNRHYLVDVLGPFFNTDVATLRIATSDGEYPVSFEAASIPGLRYVVMPIRPA